VEYIVDTSTEIPYTAPVLSSPTKENVPLKSIEFFLKFRIVNPVLFVRRIGASNFDIVLSSAVQDAIRQRTRNVETAKAYDLRGSDVGDMQRLLNETMEHYGVRITGANIPDVQLPEQYQNNLATQERISKELVAYEKEWDLMRKRRKDALELEIEQAKKERDAKLVSVREAINKARQDVALMLQEKETAAEKIKLEIEARSHAELKAAENQAKALQRLGEAYKDNQAILRFELETQRLNVAKELMRHAPRPIVVNTGQQNGHDSALSTLLLAQILPQTLREATAIDSASAVRPDSIPTGNGQSNMRSMMESLMDEVDKRTKK
jgi:regulator of protease activity HflC (stomatin/prohibitin superfamily)